jgi:hypothetical protein
VNPGIEVGNVSEAEEKIRPEKEFEMCTPH